MEARSERRIANICSDQSSGRSSSKEVAWDQEHRNSLKNKWSGKTSYEDNGEVFQIHQCDSPLAMRLALRESGDEKTTVLVTDLDDHEISDDILVRLKPRKLIPLDSWQIVKALFQVRAVDPRVTRYGWMADVLMDLIPPSGYPPVATGFLDAETVWGIVLDHYLGLSGYSLDLLAVLKWSIDTRTLNDSAARLK